MAIEKVEIHKAWRSELKRTITYLIASIVCVWLTWKYPWSVVVGKLFSFGDLTVYLHLPTFALIPLALLVDVMVKLYDVQYTVSEKGIEARIGILSFHQRITQLRFEDIRECSIEQSLLERMLDVGDIEVATAATGLTEIVLEGIGAPTEVHELIQKERDRRQSIARKKMAGNAPMRSFVE